PGPTGVADRVSVADVNPNGQTLFRADGQGLTGNWLGQPGVAAYPVSSAFLEQSFWSNGHWYVVLYPGDKLQRLDLDTAFTQQPPALTQAPTADIAIASSSAPVSLTCTLDGATYAPCGPAVHLSGLADGTHTFTAAAHDSFETDATPATVTWTVDSQPPAAFGLLSPADGAFINQAPAHFAWEATSDAGSGLDHYLVNVSGQSPTQVPAGQTSVDFNVGEGPHTWSVTAVDHAGLARTTATGSFTVDQTPPDPPQIAAPGPGNTVLTSQPTLSWTAVSDAVGYRVRLGEDDPVSTAATSYVPPALPDGAYSWTVVAIDAAGNVSAPAAAGFEVDTRPNYTLPVGISINDGAQFTNDPDVTLNVRWPKFATQMLASNDGGFGGADPVPVASLLSWHLDQSGSERLPRTVYVRFLGGTAGNETYTDDIILDHTPPVVSKARAKRRGRRFRLQLKASDRTSGVAALQLTQNRGKPGAWKPYKAKRTVRGKPHKPVFARVRDRAGNRSRWRRAKIIRR
ncbi:MAG: hypothetical protein QOI80_1690, partial [Solirubrobacteraceae bacterium]|nr:hypothetical protein [Solirubrobacteraceae bacterium]